MVFLINYCRGLLQLANSNFASAYEHFKKLTELDSTNVVVSFVFYPFIISCQHAVHT